MRFVARVLHAPLERRSRRELAYLALTLPPAVPGFLLALIGIVAATLSLVAIGIPLLAADLALARAAGSLFTVPARVTLGWTRAQPTPLSSRTVLGRSRELLRSGEAWRALLYCAVKLPMAAVGLYAAAIGYLGGLAALTYPAWWFVSPGAVGVLDDRSWTHAWILAAQGVLALLVTPWFVRVLVNLDHFLLLRLVAPDPARARIATLQASRASLAEDAAATLRRIERDLHDGTQARLVAIGVALSRMERHVTEPDARVILTSTRQQALDALQELREIIRGVHPPALDDGLPTALASLAARSPVPVELHATLHSRPTDAQATALYFSAAELLTNVARHAHARQVRVEVSDTRENVLLTVVDDGRGGATISTSGTGLAGLDRRLAALDGTLTIDSPPTGPTSITVTLPKEPPCA
jgi:signal transduction histidine kinase